LEAEEAERQKAKENAYQEHVKRLNADIEDLKKE